MKKKDLKLGLENIAKDKEISVEAVAEAFKMAMEAGCRKENGVNTCRCSINLDKGELLLFKQEEVIDPMTYNYEEAMQNRKRMTTISLEKAKRIKPLIKVGDILETAVSPEDFSVISSKEVKNRFAEYLNNAVVQKLYETYNSKINQLIYCRVISIEPKGYRLDLDGKDLTTLLPITSIMPQDDFHVGERVAVIVTDCFLNEKNKLDVKVSRVSTDIVLELLRNYVPEIVDGTVEIIGISRDPGDRSKVCVKSNKEGVDAIGSCVGESGSRIRGVKQSLNGENIDLFVYSDNPKELVKNALQPAQVIDVPEINPVEKTALAIVDDSQLSLAIGKKGQNVRLAIQAIKWSKLEILSKEQAIEQGILFNED